MKASPIQRYALRLLFASGQGKNISYDRWKSLRRDEAEQMMSPFGGQDKIIREIQLPGKKNVRKKEDLSRETNSDAPSRTKRVRENGIELGE